ncbi:hypothetical protein HDU98_004244 [Podochytrium sp. JEL0797]|nr:hypothetical protein HDU98_004244 [Podochytrium sp. JEL0797]
MSLLDLLLPEDDQDDSTSIATTGVAVSPSIEPTHFPLAFPTLPMRPSQQMGLLLDAVKSIERLPYAAPSSQLDLAFRSVDHLQVPSGTHAPGGATGPPSLHDPTRAGQAHVFGKKRKALGSGSGDADDQLQKRKEAEQKRRVQLKVCYDEIQGLLPPGVASASNRSKQAILDRASAFVLDLEKERKAKEAIVRQLESEIAALRQQ